MKIKLKEKAAVNTYISPDVYIKMSEVMESVLENLCEEIVLAFESSGDRKITMNNVNAAITNVLLFRGDNDGV